MGERLLRVDINELATVRVKQKDGTVSEVPFQNLAALAKGMLKGNTIKNTTADALVDLHSALESLTRATAEVGVEFFVKLD